MVCRTTHFEATGTVTPWDWVAGVCMRARGFVRSSPLPTRARLRARLPLEAWTTRTCAPNEDRSSRRHLRPRGVGGRARACNVCSSPPSPDPTPACALHHRPPRALTLDSRANRPRAVCCAPSLPPPGPCGVWTRPRGAALRPPLSIPRLAPAVPLHLPAGATPTLTSVGGPWPLELPPTHWRRPRLDRLMGGLGFASTSCPCAHAAAPDSGLR